MQCEFAKELFKRLHENGINTALDTAAVKPTDAVKEVLEHTDTVLCDIKFPTDEGYRHYFSASLENTLEFLGLCEKMGKSVIARHVVVPTFTDGDESILKIKEICGRFNCIKDLELLPFHKMCEEKYKKLGIPFPFKDMPECTGETISRLVKL